MNKILLTLLCACAFLLAAPADAFGCSCLFDPEERSLEEKIKNELAASKAVFAGKVLQVVKTPRRYSVKVKFRVDKVWKGIQAQTVFIFTGRGGGDCGIRFAVGESYLVYAYGDNPNRLGTNICQRTSEITGAVDDLKILGEGRPVKVKSSAKRSKT